MEQRADGGVFKCLVYNGAVSLTLIDGGTFCAEGIKTHALTGVSADSREGAVQEVANATGKVPYAYDLAWTDGAAAMRVDWVNRTREKRGPVVVTTNEVAAALSGMGTSEWTVPNEDGFDKLLLTFLDNSGNPIGEPLESPWFEKYVPLGMMLLIR